MIVIFYVSIVIWIIVLFIITNFLLTFCDKDVNNSNKKVEIKHWVIWICFIVLYFWHFTEEIYTTFFISVKPWFGLSSYIISPVSWLFNQITIFFLFLSFAILYSLIIALTHKDYTNNIKINLDKSNTIYKAKNYTTFLQTCLFVISILVFFPGIILIKVLDKMTKGLFTDFFLFNFLGVIILGIYIMYRILKRANSIKEKYKKEVKKKTDNIIEKYKKQVKKKKELLEELPPDPTGHFLGKHWWALPASLTGILTVVLIMIELLGIDKMVLNIIN